MAGPDSTGTDSAQVGSTSAGTRAAEAKSARIWAAKLDYFELPPDRWHDALTLLVGFGFTHLDVRIPWGLHDRGAGKYEFGEGQPELHARRFLEQASALGLGLCLRVGPRQERAVDLACDGLPERVVWAPECQAESRGGNPIVEPRWSGSFPEPSVFSDAYERQCVEWLGAVARELAPLLVANASMLVLDSERSERTLYTRPDYRGEALTRLRTFVSERHREPGRLAQVWGDQLGPSELQPPARPVWDGGNPAAWSDWFDFVDTQLRARAERFAQVLAEAGLAGCALGRVVRASRRSLMDTNELRFEREGLVTRITELACGFELADRSRAAPDERLLQAVSQGDLDFSLGPVLPRAGHVGSLLEEHGNPTPTGQRLCGLLRSLLYLRDTDLGQDACALVSLPLWLLRGWRLWEVWPAWSYHALSPVSHAAPSSSDAEVVIERAVPSATAVDPMIPTREQLSGVLDLLATLGAALERHHVSWRFVDAGACPGANGCWIVTPSLDPDLGTPASKPPHLVARGSKTADHSQGATLDAWLTRVTSSAPRVSFHSEGVRVVHFSATGPTTQKSSNIQSRAIVLSNFNDTEIALSVQYRDTLARDTGTGELVQPIEGRLDLTVPARTVRVLELRPTVGPGDLDRDELRPDERHPDEPCREDALPLSVPDVD